MQVAVDAREGSGRLLLGEAVDPFEDLVAAVQHRRSRIRGTTLRRREHVLGLAVHPVDPRLEIGWFGVARAQHSRERDVHLGHGASQVADALLHGRVSLCATEDALDVGRGERPALLATVDEVGEDAQSGHRSVSVTDAEGTQLARRVGEPGLGERAGDLDVGVLACLQPPEQLQDRRVRQDDRGVGLLGGHAPRVVQRHLRLAEWPSEHDLAARGQTLAGLLRQRRQDARGGRDVGGVHERDARHGADCSVSVEGPRGQRYLVALGVAVVVGHLDEHLEHQVRLVGRRQQHRVVQRQPGEVAGLAAEPALLGYPVAQDACELVERVGRRECGKVGHSSSSSISWNQ